MGRKPVASSPGQNICLELEDYSTRDTSAVEFFGLKAGRDPQPQAARLAEQFIVQNRPFFDLLSVAVSRDYDGSDVWLRVETGNAVGAVPLLSPFSAKPDFGLVVQPRFPWKGIGPMLAETGWAVSPALLRLPLLKRSERRVPPWVLAFTVLARLKALLDKLERRFEVTEQEVSAPKGAVLWEQYAVRHMARGRFLDVPCRFPDLRDDRRLKGAIRYAVERQIQSLETQREHGGFIQALIALAEMLLMKVHGAPACRPSPREFDSWLRQSLKSDVLVEGVQAIEWTVEERGLAGLSDLEGIPWTMPMEQFFEAWVETIFRAVAVRTGGSLKAGRKRETVAPLLWDPPYLGSQRSLVPDLILEHEQCTLIVDAKYKRHWEEIRHGLRTNHEDAIREEHRHDIHQVLAYANLSEKPVVVCCLIYPCTAATWASLLERRRLFHQAEIPQRSRRLSLWLTAVPMCAAAERAAGPIVEKLRETLSVLQ